MRLRVFHKVAVKLLASAGRSASKMADSYGNGREASAPHLVDLSIGPHQYPQDTSADFPHSKNSRTERTGRSCNDFYVLDAEVILHHSHRTHFVRNQSLSTAPHKGRGIKH